MIVFLDGLFGISFSVSQALRTLMGEIIALIFSLIEYLYDIFIYLAKAQILSNDFIESIYRKVGMILGIFMVFKLSFTLINSLITPSKLNDKKSGFAAIIFRSVIAIVLFGITPSIFKEAYNLQNLIIGGGTTDNIIYKLVANQDSNINLNDLGRKLSSDLYFSFYTDNENPKLEQGISDDPSVCNSDDQTEDEKVYCDRFRDDNFKTLVSDVEAGDRSFYDTVPYLAIENNDVKNNEYKYVIEYNWLLLLIVGVLTVWMLVMYCIQVGVRVIQLGYLQLIAPIPILSYIAEPEGSFKKWLNQCVSTFLDLFIRLAIIYFVMTTIGTIIEQFNNASGIIFESTGIPANESFTLALVKIFIILGLLLFAKKVPDLLKEVFPSLGGSGKFDFGLSAKKVFKGTLAEKAFGGIAGAAAGGAIGLIGGYGVGGRIKGLVGGVTKGAASGMKGKKISEITAARAAQNVKYRQIMNSESTFGGRVDASLRNTFGMESKTAVINRQIDQIDNSDLALRNKYNSAIIGYEKEIKDVAETEILKKDSAAQAAKLRLDFVENNIGKFDPSLGRTLNSSDVINQRKAYKSYMDDKIESWVDDPTLGGQNAKVQGAMQGIQNITGNTVSNFSQVSSAANEAKSQVASDARAMKVAEDKKEQLGRDKRAAQADENAIKK